MRADAGERLRGARAGVGRANTNGPRLWNELRSPKRRRGGRERAALGVRGGGRRALPVVLCSHFESVNHLDIYFTPDVALEARNIFRH